MKNHINKVVSIFNDKQVDSIYRSIGGTEDGVRTYILTDSTYKNVYSKLQKKPIYKDGTGDVFYIKDGMICEKTRPAVCLSGQIHKLINADGDYKYVTHSPAAQLASFLTKEKFDSENLMDLISQVKPMTENLFHFFLTKPKDKSVEPINIGFINIDEFSKTKGVEVPLFFVTTQIVQRDVPYFFHSSFGMLHYSEITDEHIYGMTTTQEDFEKWKSLVQQTKDAPDGVFTYPMIKLKQPMVIFGDGETLLEVFEKMEETELVS